MMEKISPKRALEFNKKAMQINKTVTNMEGKNLVEKINLLTEEQKKAMLIPLDFFLMCIHTHPHIDDNEKATFLGLVSAILDCVEIEIDEDVRIAATEDAIENGYKEEI